MLLATAAWPLAFDMYLLRFSVGDEIPPHQDQVNNGEHHRVNIILKHAKEGGLFICHDAIYDSSRIKYFRPDQSVHQVTKIIQGSRYVFSIGWNRKA
ncbi:hypothetical protein [Arenicella xantha]|uniref:2-oxoglutarate-Fe(II)-dependent oxygenase superfamily protein n=1 Tax=Arenicella xantha TaxID=644221 RepID=A0A395JGF6_9GAMM|nr:hypothetical protein [Arenicella xantha]RBP48946.1 hypothetical protein DFR28_105286 [Arenicella xantha]